MKRELSGAKKIAIDMIINLAGTGISLVVLQLIIYPIVAGMIDSDSYGQMQSIMSVVYLVCGTMGLTLCTTRLVRRYDYETSGLTGDFNLISIICIAISFMILPIIIVFYIGDVDVVDVLLIALLGLLNFTSSYLIVGFRININYKAIFLDKVFACVGYGIGFAIFCFIRRWEFIFIVSFLFETAYCAVKTGLLHEPLKKTQLLVKTRRTFVNLGIASLLSRGLTYFDKLLLYPILGGTAVSIYYTANVFGKLILMTIEPITNVVLSYLSKQKTVSKSVWKTSVPISAIGCGLMYLVCLFVSKPIISWFYPQWAEEAVKLVPITTLCLAISAFLGIMGPFTLKTLESNKQIVISVIGIVVYIVFALLLYRKNGIVGCCFALLFSYIAKLILIAVFCIRALGNTGKEH